MKEFNCLRWLAMEGVRVYGRRPGMKCRWHKKGRAGVARPLCLFEVALGLDDVDDAVDVLFAEFVGGGLDHDAD